MVLCAECRVSWDTEFGPLVTGYIATCGNDDSKTCFICCSAREVGNFAEVGFSEPGLDYCLIPMQLYLSRNKLDYCLIPMQLYLSRNKLDYCLIPMQLYLSRNK